MKRSLSLLGAGIFCASSLLVAPHVFAAGPSVSTVSPATATANVPVTFTATIQSSVAIQSCNLYVDLDDKGPMTVSGSTATASYTFTSGGSRIAFVFCKDANGGMASGPNTSIWVNGAITQQAPLSNTQTQTASPTVSETQTETASTTEQMATSTVPVRELFKLACPEMATEDDPCRAVYYAGADGKRHAFPNAHVYFTWYQDFSGVKTVSQEDLSAVPLGKNVTYRPGVKMVKFTTLNKVYAVGKDGVLHWITSEDVAASLYGADWNTKIDDIPDTFYTDYTFGADVTAPTDYPVTQEMDEASTID